MCETRMRNGAKCKAPGVFWVQVSGDNGQVNRLHPSNAITCRRHLAVTVERIYSTEHVGDDITTAGRLPVITVKRRKTIGSQYAWR